MSESGASITAILKLNTEPFETSLGNTKKAVNQFKNSMLNIGKNSELVSSGIQQISRALDMLLPSLKAFKTLTENVDNFKKFANGLKTMSEAVINFSNVTKTSQVGMIRIQEIMNMWSQAVRGLVVNIRNASEVESIENQRLREKQQALANARNSYSESEATIRSFARSIQAAIAEEERENSTLERSRVLRLTNAEMLERYTATITRNSQAMQQNAVAQLRAMGYTGSLSAEATKSASSFQRQSTAMSQASANATRMTSASNSLKNALSSLRMIGTMVASMMVYNFAHNLITATRETVNAKSEMEGYFKMLNFGQREIDNFNKALDRTVQQFQRVNKYSLGETISSIGVEFNLSTKEMEKAMKVTSMITSEYLRAGRNANEASLAVKDVLQGQFQRLSRETGVKGEQLKDAGWSGDTKDVLGLMEALEKVGESRNWQVFAEKANSLNDIVTILQNRFGEWSADMVYAVQPTIVGVFNMIMETGQKMANVFTGIWEWMNGDSIEGQASKWALVSAGIMGVVTALVVYRTGANLVSIAQMGLTKTITATVLGLEAETVATYGTRTAIMSKIFGLEAEKVATLNVRNAIMSKVLGLDAELVAQTSLKQGILDKAFAQELEMLRLKGATSEELLNTLALYENELAHKSSIGILSAHILKLDMTTYATHGFRVALLQSTTQMEASKIASMGLGKQLLLLGASFGVPLAIVSAFAVGLGILAFQMHESAEAMKEFNTLVKDGQSIIKENKEIVKDYSDRQEELKKKLNETKEGTLEYYNVQQELLAVNKDLDTANKNLENSTKAVETAVSSQKHYEERLTQLSIEHQKKLAQAYMDAGYSMQEAYEMANDSLIDAQKGAEQLRQTLQKIAVLDYKGEQNVNYLLSQGKEYGIDKDVTKQYTVEAERLNKRAKDSLEKAMTDESFMGRMDGWFNYYETQFEKWINNIKASVETGDWTEIGGTIGMGILHGFADLPYIKDFWNWVYKETGLSNYEGAMKDFDWKEFFASIPDPVSDLSNWIANAKLDTGWIDDWFNSLFEPLKDFDLLSLIFGQTVSASDGSSDHPSFMDDLSSILGFDIQSWVESFTSDPLGTLGIDLSGFDIIGTLTSFIFGNGDGSTDPNDISWINNIFPISAEGMMTWVNDNIINPFATGISQGIASIPIVSNIAQMLGLIPQENQDAQDKGSQLARAFGNAIETTIGGIPIIGDIARLLGLIPSQNSNANSKGQGIGQNVDQGTRAGMGTMGDWVIQEFKDALSGIGKLGQEAYNTAQAWANQLWNGVNSILQRASPGFFHDQIKLEFGTDIPNAINESGATAYTSAQTYAQQMYDGMSSVNNDFTLGSVADEYQADAQTIATYSQMMGMDTTTAFNDMVLSVNQVTGTMEGNVVTSYTNMQQKQNTLLNTMKTSNTTAYQQMYTQSNQSLLQMRDSTSNVTHQMINAWDHMKVQLVATANSLRSESTNHFNELSSTIGSFYRKIQNPSNWGAGAKGGSTNYRTSRNPTVGRRVGRALHGAGTGAKYSGGSTMSIASLKHMLCPNGDCGNLFDGYQSGDMVDVAQFIRMVEGEHGFGWSGWNRTHYNHIKNKSDNWDMKSPVINLVGGIGTNSKFKVGDFNNGQPKISFGSFQSMAESIFSAIPYRYYYDSSWKGSWLGALQAGACNCSDGADALIAFARTCGFSGYKQWGTWDGEGHFWAVINGVPMDTTAWQNGYGWTSPKVSGYGSPMVRTATPSGGSSQQSREVNITIDMSNSTVYGVEDLDERIEEGVKRGLREEFNDPRTVLI